MERLKADPRLAGDIVEVPPEGSLLPDTYRIAKGTSREELIRRMQGKQKEFLEGLWSTRSRDLQTWKPEDIVNIAAIVEKEASQARTSGLASRRFIGTGSRKGCLFRPTRRSSTAQATEKARLGAAS